MSGIEVAGLALGVLPIVLEIFKSYKSTSERLNALRHHVQIAFDLRLQYNLEESSFRNECQHLLTVVIDDTGELKDMLKNTNHNLWHDRTIEERLLKFLDQDYELCEEIVVKIRDTLREIAEELSYLCEAADETKDASRTERLRLAFKVSSKKNRHRSRLENLDYWNSKFRNLTSQHCQLLEKSRFSSACIMRKQIPSEFSLIRSSSQSLHDALKDAWSCNNTSHASHQSKLSLAAKHESEAVGLEMAISCRQRDLSIGDTPSCEPPTWLYVQSVTAKADRSEQHQTPGPYLLNSTSASFFDIPLIQPTSAKQQGRNGKKRVRFESAADNDADKGQAPPAKGRKPAVSRKDSDATQCHVMHDLRKSKSICCHLKQTGCLGYLEAKNALRLVFYDASKQKSALNTKGKQTKGILTLDRMLPNLSILQQLTLAHKLAVAVLQYHSTSWLPQDWNLQDLAFFTDKPELPEDALLRDLETLHLSTQFPTKDTSLIQPNNGASSATDSGPLLHVDDAKYRYNIRNMTLANLGMALLEIGHKKDIQAFGHPREAHQVVNARKILDGNPTVFSEKYQTIVRKCMDCNFSVGYDLEETDLQSAVFTDIVCELEKMLKAWKRMIGKA